MFRSNISSVNTSRQHLLHFESSVNEREIKDFLKAEISQQKKAYPEGEQFLPKIPETKTKKQKHLPSLNLPGTPELTSKKFHKSLNKVSTASHLRISTFRNDFTSQNEEFYNPREERKWGNKKLKETIQTNCVKSFSIKSKTGKKAGKPKKFNQDSSFFQKDFFDQKHSCYFGIFDGHGPSGHLISDLFKKKLPSNFSLNYL